MKTLTRIQRINYLFSVAEAAYNDAMNCYQYPFDNLCSYEFELWRNMFFTCFYAISDAAKHFYSCDADRFKLLARYYERLSNIRYNWNVLEPEIRNNTLF